MASKHLTTVPVSALAAILAALLIGAAPVAALIFTAHSVAPAFGDDQ